VLKVYHIRHVKYQFVENCHMPCAALLRQGSGRLLMGMPAKTSIGFFNATHCLIGCHGPCHWAKRTYSFLNLCLFSRHTLNTVFNPAGLTRVRTSLANPMAPHDHVGEADSFWRVEFAAAPAWDPMRFWLEMGILVLSSLVLATRHVAADVAGHWDSHRGLEWIP
jgi:hypothetical protein